MCSLSYKEQKQNEAAYHEAGHIFLLALFGYTVINASINEDIDKGDTNYRPRINPSSLEDKLDKYIAACIATAGVVSEARFRGIHNPSALFYEGGLDDLGQFMQTGLSKDFLGPMIDVANQILESHKGVISKIADELYKKKSLTQEEIGDLLNDVSLAEESKKYKNELVKIEPDPSLFSE